MRMIPEVEQTVVEGELPGDVALIVHRAANGTAGREQQRMMVLAQINDRAFRSFVPANQISRQPTQTARASC